MVHPHVVVPALKHRKLSHQLPSNMQDFGIRDKPSRGRSDYVKSTGHEFTRVHPQQGWFSIHSLNAVALQLRDVAMGKVAGKVDLETSVTSSKIFKVS